MRSRGASTDWLEKAKGYLAINDYDSAAYAAREATQTQGNSPECWWVRSRANLGLKRLDDAFYEAQQSVQLETANPEYRFHLGAVAEGLARWDKAIQEYREAARLDPQETIYQLAVGAVYLQNGRPEEALPIFQLIHREHPDDEMAAYYFASALVESAERVPSYRQGASYMVTTGEEVSKMWSLVNQAAAIRNLPSDMMANIRQVREYLDQMTKSRFHSPIGKGQLHGQFRSTIACGVVLLLLVLFALSGILSVFGGHLGSFVFGLVCAGAAYCGSETPGCHSGR